MVYNDTEFALPVRVTGVSNNVGISSNYAYKIILVKLKNKYDGVYKPTGTMVDVTNPNFVSLSSAGKKSEYTFETVSATKCVVTNSLNYAPGTRIIPFWTGTAISGYGSFAPVVEFDPATDKIISVTNSFGQPAVNTRSAQLDPTGVNRYDAATKSLKIKYVMRQPNVVAAAPNIRVTWDETWEFLRDR